MNKFLKVSLLIVLAILVLNIPQAWAVVMLPDPDTIIRDQNGNIIYVPNTSVPETLAVKYGDFYAYSAKLNTLLGYQGFDGASGTGGLDIIVYTGSGGADNDPVSGNYKFPDPLNTPSGNATSFAGVWGPADNNGHSAVKVDALLGYMQSFRSDLSVPIFNFDMNTGNDDYITIAGKVSIWDPSTNTEKAFWSFDLLDNGLFDPNDPVYAPKELTIGPYSVSNSGSGKNDYIAYAPDMDLNNWDGFGYEFRADFRLGSLNHGGFEELYLTGAFAPYSNNTVPEPASIALIGMGLLGILGLRKKV